MPVLGLALSSCHGLPERRVLRGFDVRSRTVRSAPVIGFGEHARAEARLVRCALQPEGSTVEADIMGTRVAIGVAVSTLALSSAARR